MGDYGSDPLVRVFLVSGNLQFLDKKIGAGVAGTDPSEVDECGRTRPAPTFLIGREPVRLEGKKGNSMTMEQKILRYVRCRLALILRKVPMTQSLQSSLADDLPSSGHPSRRQRRKKAKDDPLA